MLRDYQPQERLEVLILRALDQVKHGLKSYSFVQFLLGRNKTTQTQKGGLNSDTLCLTHNAEAHMTQVSYSTLHLNHFLQKYSFNTTSLLLLPSLPKLPQKTTTLILSYFASAHGNLNSCNETQKDWSLSAMQNPNISLK